MLLTLSHRSSEQMNTHPLPLHNQNARPPAPLTPTPAKKKQRSVANRTQTSTAVHAMYTVVLVYAMYKHTAEPIQRLSSRVPSSMKYSRVFWQIRSIFSKEPAASSFILKDGGSPFIYNTFYKSIKLHGVISQKNAMLLFAAVMS